MHLARAIEHTLLRPTASEREIDVLCREAIEHGLRAVCVAPEHVARAALRVRGSAVAVVSVAGFPLGSSVTEVKALEARRAVEDGAVEIDVVLSLAAAAQGRWDAVTEQLARVREAAAGAALKVILETGYLAPEAIAQAVEASVAAGAAFVKTSTGMGPRGASIEDVRLMHAAARGRIAIKAAGGIRDAAVARALLEAGATRIGTSVGPRLVGAGG